MAVRWYLRYVFSYREVEELLAERGIEVDQVSAFRWVAHVRDPSHREDLHDPILPDPGNDADLTFTGSLTDSHHNGHARTNHRK